MNVTVLILQKKKTVGRCSIQVLPVRLSALLQKKKGLGTVIMGIFDEDKITELLEIPEERELAALIAVGWPDIDPEVPKEKRG